MRSVEKACVGLNSILYLLTLLPWAKSNPSETLFLDLESRINKKNTYFIGLARGSNGIIDMKSNVTC